MRNYIAAVCNDAPLIHRNNRSEEAFDSASGHRDGPLR
jgi:hypothetical protein